MEQRYLILLRRWFWLLALSAIFAGATTYLILKDQPTIYEAQTRLIIGPGIDTPDPDVNALRAGGQLMQTYAEISMTSPFLQSIITELELDTTPLAIRENIEISTNQETQILSFNVSHSNPERAIAIANRAADKLVELSPSGPDSSSSLLKEQMRVQAEKIEAIIDQSEENIRKLESDLQAITQVENQSVVVLQTDNYLEKQRLIIEQLSQERARLSESLSALTILYETLQKTTTNQVKIIEPAVIAIPVPSYLLIKVVLGLVAGFVLAGAFVLAFAYFDETILTHEELRQAGGVNTLGVITKHDRLSGPGPERLVVSALPNSKAAENYRLIETKLLLADEDSRLRSVLLSSLGEEADGETGLIASNLAYTIAKSGKKVALVDGNLHNPFITELLDLRGKLGLTNALLNPGEELNLIPLAWSPNLFVLPHGTGSSIPFELLSSDRMMELVEELKNDVDIVLIDASSLLTFAHNHVLATKVDGVVMMAQQGSTHWTEARELVNSLQSLKVNIVGVIFDYNRSRKSIRWRDRLVGSIGSQVRSLANKIKGAFQERTASQLSPLKHWTSEKNPPNIDLSEAKDAGTPEPTSKENLEKDVFSIQVTKN